MKKFALLVAGLACASCAHTMPVSVMMADGQRLKGSTTVTPERGSFFAAGANGLHCSGDYDPWDNAKFIVVSANCNDGRTATLSINRDDNVLAGGSGAVKMSDGKTGVFLFGSAADRF